MREDSKRERERERRALIGDLDKMRGPVLRCGNSAVTCSCCVLKRGTDTNLCVIFVSHLHRVCRVS